MPSIAKNFGLNIFINVSRVIFPLITAPYVSRILGPEGIGIFGFSNTYVSYFVLIALLGIPMYGIREVAKVKENIINLSESTSQLFTISVISTSVVTLIYIASIFLIPKLAEKSIIFFVAGTTLYLCPFQIDWYYQGNEKFDFITIRTLIVRCISLICIFLFVRVKNDLIYYVLINASGIVVANIWSFLYLKKELPQLHLTIRNLSHHMRPMMYLFISSIATSIYIILDTIMLGFMTDYSQVGFYTNASSISRTLVIIVTSLSAVAIPRIASYYKEGRIYEINMLLEKSFSVIAYLSIPISIGLICISPVLATSFFGESFSGSIVPLMIMSGIVISIGFNNLYGIQILVSIGLEKCLLCAVSIGAIINLIVNLLIIPRYGAIGASVSSVLAETFILIFTIYFVNKRTNIKMGNTKYDILKPLMGSLLFIPVCYILRIYFDGWTYLLITIPVAGSIYCLSQIIFKQRASMLLTNLIRTKCHITR